MGVQSYPKRACVDAVFVFVWHYDACPDSTNQLIIVFNQYLDHHNQSSWSWDGIISYTSGRQPRLGSYWVCWIMFSPKNEPPVETQVTR